MRLKYLALASFFTLAALVCRSGRADTLTLESVGGQNAGGYYVYPYNFSVNESSTLDPMMCLDFSREVTVGETWQATELGIPTGDSPNSQEYREDAWIFAQVGGKDPQSGATYTNAEVQYAVWDIFDPSDTSANGAFDGASSYLEQQAMLEANSATLVNSGFFNQFEIFAPTGDTTGWTDGTPQRFIAESTAVTPEPSSLLLLRTGLIGMGILLLRRPHRPGASGKLIE